MFDVWKTVARLGQPCLMRPVSQSAIDGSDGTINNAVLRSIDECLWEHVEHTLLESHLPPVQEECLYTEDKWLTTSALQKSIRRGHFELAERYARSGVRIDADHTFRRLAIIALEDVGLGELKLIAACLAVLSDQRRRARVGAEQLAASLAIQLSKAVKSRAACEMLSLVECDPDVAAFAAELSSPERREFVVGLRSETFGSARQMLALFLLHGTDRLRCQAMLPLSGAGVVGVLRLMVNMRSPLIFHYIVRMGLSRCRDTLSLPYAVLAQHVKENGPFDVVRRECHVVEYIGSYPTIAFDMHTQSGRSAIRKFEVNCRELLRSTGVRSAANLVFALEGGLLDRQLTSPKLRGIRDRASQLEVFGYANASQGDLLSHMKLPPILDDFRRQIGVRR